MEIKVPAGTVLLRLDRFLKHWEIELPVSLFYRLLRKGKIRVNGSPVRDARHQVQSGDFIFIEGFSSERNGNPSLKKPALSVLFEDQVLLVIDKPRGISVHPGKGREKHTLIRMLKARAHDDAPFLVHRLDKYTSGVFIVAKNRETAGLLGKRFGDRQGNGVKKRYLVIVFGQAPKNGSIDTLLDGQDAHTRYTLIQKLAWHAGFLSLLEVEIITGRTHQIRRHLASINLPVAGDDEYGNWELNKLFLKDFRIREYVLHASDISLPHPVSHERMRFTAPIPAEILKIFGNCREELKRKYGARRMEKNKH